MLDLGCGRGEFLSGFIAQGIYGFGIDQADSARKICPSAKIKIEDIEKKLPFKDNFFDVVYSKSVLEHFYYPEKILIEIHRILKPGGIVITMTPDWAYDPISFYDEFTHRTPFTLQSLNQIHNLCQFKNVVTERFVQLPFVWKMPFLRFITTLCRNFLPDKLSKHSKFVKFSKEIMLLTKAIK